MRPVSPGTTIAYLGPPGTFSEEALRSQQDLNQCHLIPEQTFVDVCESVSQGRSDLGFIALENSIEGTVNVSLDELVFNHDLYIVREVELRISQHLLVKPGTKLADIETVTTYPHAMAQCRTWLAANLPNATQSPSTSTAEAASKVASDDNDGALAAIANHLAASIYELEVLASQIEDHEENTTRFVLVSRPDKGIPAPSGHDKTSIVCFQSADHPGSLHTILGQFAARNLNLTRLESRPTKKALGDYCFVIDVEGHIEDEIVADCLRDLHATLPEVKFLGSYPAAGKGSDQRRRNAEKAWHAADEWIDDLRQRVQAR